LVRTLRREDFPEVIALCRKVYPGSPPWTEAQLESHLTVFPEGQLVAVRAADREVVGYAASLIIRWNDYSIEGTWRDFTQKGTFTNHDVLHGRTLYGAEVMVDPSLQRSGVGTALYRRRRELAVELGLLRIRAASRLRGYRPYAREMTAEEYVQAVVRGELKDPTLSFQLREGFRVIQVVSGYIVSDPESLGYAAVIEWLNAAVARESDCGRSDPRFQTPEPLRGTRPSE
jgi:ribosomal protein S18 acetylase RimI-like enzyme